MSTDEVGELATRLIAWLQRLMPAGPRLDAVAADLGALTGDRSPVGEETCRAVEARAQRHSRHLELHFDAASTAEPDDEPRGWPPPDHDDIRTRAAAVSSVQRTDDGAWVLRLDGLEPLAVAGPYLEPRSGSLPGPPASCSTFGPTRAATRRRWP
jgi:hypothetical protein